MTQYRKQFQFLQKNVTKLDNKVKKAILSELNKIRDFTIPVAIRKFINRQFV